MKTNLMMAAAIAIGVLGTSAAEAGKNCKFLPTVDQCARCKLEQKNVRYGPAAVNDWCAKQIAQRQNASPASFRPR